MGPRQAASTRLEPRDQASRRRVRAALASSSGAPSERAQLPDPRLRRHAQRNQYRLHRARCRNQAARSVSAIGRSRRRTRLVNRCIWSRVFHHSRSWRLCLRRNLGWHRAKSHSNCVVHLWRQLSQGPIQLWSLHLKYRSLHCRRAMSSSLPSRSLSPIGLRLSADARY